MHSVDFSFFFIILFIVYDIIFYYLTTLFLFPFPFFFPFYILVFAWMLLFLAGACTFSSQSIFQLNCAFFSLFSGICSTLLHTTHRRRKTLDSFMLGFCCCSLCLLAKYNSNYYIIASRLFIIFLCSLCYRILCFIFAVLYSIVYAFKSLFLHLCCSRKKSDLFVYAIFSAF